MFNVTPPVSVIIPTYNRSDLVQQAIDSVLAQTLPAFEIIVIDDGSTDDTEQAMRHYGAQICYVRQENRGESAARNRGIGLARGEYVGFLDSDDFWHPTKLERQLEVLQTDPSTGLVYCQALKIDAAGKRLPGPIFSAEINSTPATFENLCRKNLFAPSTVVMRRTLLDKVGGFDEAIQYGEDWDLWLRSALVMQIQGIPDPLASVRIHQGGQWWFPKPEKVQRVLADHIRLLSKAFDLWSDHSEAAQALRAQCLAREYGLAALANYAFQEGDLARSQLQEAIRLNPVYWGEPDSVYRELLGFALRMGQSNPGNLDAPPAYVRAVMRNLPHQLSDLSSQTRRLAAHVDVELAYHFLSVGETGLARACLTRGIFTDPRWLRNRGVSAELLKLWFGHRSVRIARQLLLRPGS